MYQLHQAHRTGQASVIDFPQAREVEEASVKQFAARLCNMTFETILGMRAFAQIQPLVSPAVASKISARMAMTCQLLQQPTRCGALALNQLHTNVQVVHTRLYQVNVGVWEISVVLAEPSRHRAVALRVEKFRGKWRATCMEIG